VALGITVLLFPVVQPWYLLWAIIPLAAWASRTGFREAVILITLIVGIFGPTANGDRFALFQIVDATLASAFIVLVLIVVTYRRLPWRPLPPRPADDREPTDSVVAEVVPAVKTADTPRPAAAPDAYADST
jgi:alpha-1,6-mannosyltransferase